MKYSILFIFPFMFSCQPVQESDSYKEQLIGKWTNIYMKVDMHSHKNTDSLKTMEVTEADWEKIMGIKPILTSFNADGTYNSEHRNLKDSIVYNPAGTWRLEGDSLIMTDTFPQKGLTYMYKINIRKENGVIAEFWGVEDFDQDEKKDDNYYGKQRKQ